MESLDKILKNIKIPPKIKDNLEIFSKIKYYWPQILEDKTSYAFPLKVEEGTLFIAVNNHYELQELNTKYIEILNRIKKLLDEKESHSKIKAIKFIYSTHKNSLSKPEERKVTLKLEKEVWSGVERELSQLLDNDLKKVLQNLLSKYKEAHSG